MAMILLWLWLDRRREKRRTNRLPVSPFSRGRPGNLSLPRMGPRLGYGKPRGVSLCVPQLVAFPRLPFFSSRCLHPASLAYDSAPSPCLPVGLSYVRAFSIIPRLFPSSFSIRANPRIGCGINPFPIGSSLQPSSLFRQ